MHLFLYLCNIWHYIVYPVWNKIQWYQEIFDSPISSLTYIVYLTVKISAYIYCLWSIRCCFFIKVTVIWLFCLSDIRQGVVTNRPRGSVSAEDTTSVPGVTGEYPQCCGHNEDQWKATRDEKQWVQVIMALSLNISTTFSGNPCTIIHCTLP